MRLAVYAGTRNIYHDMLVSAKSLLYHHGADQVVFLIEDDTFPEPIPPCIFTMNVSNQPYFTPGGPNYARRWTYMVLMRMAIPKLFPTCDRVLSLDHDTIVRKPIDPLWNTPLSECYFAAVEEKQIHGRQHPYFNFGVLMLNVDKLLRDGMCDRIIDALNTRYFGYCEQDAANDLCREHIYHLPPAYNAFSFQSPPVPDPDVIIRHYAGFKSNLRSFQDYQTYDRMSWGEVLYHTLRTRHDVINAFIADRGYHSFLEIGTDTGVSLRTVHADYIVSVDPDPSTPATHHMTSDNFFASYDDRFDIIFIDGLHECHQAYRDILNALCQLNPNGVIVMHDCLPTSEPMQRPSDHYPGGAWTGDVWKAFVKAQSSLPHLVYTIDVDFGCGIIDTTMGVTKESVLHLPSDMDTMTYNQFVRYRDDWMNVKGGIIYG